MPHNCRTHCPSGGHGAALRDLIVFVALFGAFLWGVGKVAPVVDAGMTRVAVVVSAVAGFVALAVTVGLVARAVLNRRTLARWDRERVASAAQHDPPRESRALTEAARELEAAPTVRAEAFVVRDELRDAA